MGFIEVYQMTSSIKSYRKGVQKRKEAFAGLKASNEFSRFRRK